MLNSVPWGSSRPRFHLLPPLRTRVARRVGQRTISLLHRLSGKFTFTNGSAVVVTTGSMEDILLAGDVLTPLKTRKYFVASVDSATQVTLTAPYANVTQNSVAGYTSREHIWMPLTKATSFRFPEFGLYGGPTEVELEDGSIIYRGAGYRPFVEFQWEALSADELSRIATLYDHRFNGRIEVQPHDEVPISWMMLPVGEFNPHWTSGKLIGSDITVLFRATGIITNIPQNFATEGAFSPLIF
ncbi:MAG: hypothetical protein P9M15_00865 [Candidatus Electryoneaceae bacterium]|nr:hypothetical protein [Candidatus Electryoneaceae bacterium]